MSDNTQNVSAEVVIPDDIAERFKADLRKVQPYPDGTIVAFTSVDVRGAQWHYAAIFAGGKWHLSTQGNSVFPGTATNQEFMALLHSRGHSLTDVKIATGFTPIHLDGN